MEEKKEPVVIRLKPVTHPACMKCANINKGCDFCVLEIVDGVFTTPSNWKGFGKGYE